MVLVLALTVLLLLVIYLLFIPILLVINTETESYYLQAKGLFHAKVVSDDVELVILKLKLLGWSFEYYPLQNGSNAQMIKQRSFKEVNQEVLKSL
jgi:hypothetical protein